MDEKDCGFKRNAEWFRYRVGAIIIEDGHILLASDNVSDYYYSVGGGVHHGETSRDAIEREVFEETGVHYAADRLAVVHENFFANEKFSLKGFNCHEVALYYIMKPRGTRELPAHKSISSCGIERMTWLPVDKLDGLKLFPVFFKTKLSEIISGGGIRHIVTRE